MVRVNLRPLTLLTSNGGSRRVHGRILTWTRSYRHSRSVMLVERRPKLVFGLQFGEVTMEFRSRSYKRIVFFGGQLSFA
uniref:Uncharacterized protein n=1 Tax=Hyaloperonospora arabidopsidis (strain Emoy2) TaxID=559515 RepID=M4BZC4_HYAAE